MANRRTAPGTMTGDALRDIGGAVVRRRFSHGGKELLNGMVLSAGEVENLRPTNRKALIDNGFIQVFPKPMRSHLESDLDATPVQRHAVSIGFGRWDVIEGKKVNAEPLTKEQAFALAKPVEYQPVPKVQQVLPQVNDVAPLQVDSVMAPLAELKTT